jgi:two-component system chemotaxis response regulator CheY
VFVSEGKKTVVLVGHCGPDSWALKSAIGSAVPGVEILSADTSRELDAVLGRADLLLINRVLDGGFKGLGGIELIQSLRGHPKAMLISNYPDAQEVAEAAGAIPGFGKSEMYAERTRSRLRAALGLDVQGSVDSTRI